MRVTTNRRKKAEPGPRLPEPLDEDRPQVLRPGILLPLIGYGGAFAMAAGAVAMAIFADAGGGHAGIPPRGDWHAIGHRLLAGEICVLFTWVLYKAGSMRIILGSATMRIVSWALTWTVGRNEVSDVELSASELTIRLADGSRIRPMMFWSSAPGVIYFRLGLFANSMSRETICARILEWRQPPPGSPGTAARAGRRDRRWRVRADLWLLLGMAAAIAVEAVLVTAWW